MDLGDFGTFWLKVTTEGAETSDVVTSDNIKNVLPRFTPGKAFKDVLDDIEFEKGLNLFNEFPEP